MRSWERSGDCAEKLLEGDVAMGMKNAVLGATCVLLMATGSAHALSFSYDFTGADWSTPDITGVHGYGDPSQTPSWADDAGISAEYGGPKRLRLTNNSGGQLGNAWLNADTYAANAPWSAEFTFQITYETGGGADAMAFFAQEVGTTANTWYKGQGLGSEFLAVAFDTWNNGDECNVDFGLLVFNNGAQSGSCVDLTGLGSLANDRYNVSMSFDGTTALTVNVTNLQTTTSTGNLSYTVDLTTLDQATLGWSGQNGGAGENHDVLNFSGTFVPEPSTGALLALGLAGLGAIRRRA